MNVGLILALLGSKGRILWVGGARSHERDHPRKTGTCVHLQYATADGSQKPLTAEGSCFQGNN